jgi:hypothetical protein
LAAPILAGLPFILEFWLTIAVSAIKYENKNPSLTPILGVPEKLLYGPGFLLACTLIFLLMAYERGISYAGGRKNKYSLMKNQRTRSSRPWQTLIKPQPGTCSSTCLSSVSYP